MPVEVIELFKNKKVKIGYWDGEAKVSKRINCYVEKLKKAELVFDYNIESGGNTVELYYNYQKVFDYYCGLGGCKGKETIDITDLFTGTDDEFLLKFYKAPVWHPGEKTMYFTAVLRIEYEGAPPEEPKTARFNVYRGTVKLSHLDSEKTVGKSIYLEYDESETTIISSRLIVSWSVDAGQMACDVLFNGQKVGDFYCGLGGCSETKSFDVSIGKFNELKFRVYKTVWHPFASTTNISAVLEIKYIGKEPRLSTAPVFALDWTKLALVVGGGVLAGAVIGKLLSEKKSKSEKEKE